jgi:hypothetical protein
MKYVISNKCHTAISKFYHNVSKKYKHTYSKEMMIHNIHNTYQSLYKIENGLLRRKPKFSRWKGLLMANTKKWYFAYNIVGDTVYVEDACHAQNMHEFNSKTVLEENKMVKIILGFMDRLNKIA